MRDEYDFSPEDLRKGVRGKYAERLEEEMNLEKQPVPGSDALAMLEKLIGTVRAPSDWAAEHDHYLYGVPKRVDQEL